MSLALSDVKFTTDDSPEKRGYIRNVSNSVIVIESEPATGPMEFVACSPTCSGSQLWVNCEVPPAGWHCVYMHVSGWDKMSPILHHPFPPTVTNPGSLFISPPISLVDAEDEERSNILGRHNVRILGEGEKLLFMAHGFGTNQQVAFLGHRLRLSNMDTSTGRSPILMRCRRGEGGD